VAEQKTGKTIHLPPEVETVGAAIRYIREERGMSLRGLARLVGVSAPFLGDVENDRRNTDKLEQIAQGLDVPVDLLTELDRRVSPQLKKWVQNEPQVIDLLRELKESKTTAEELRLQLQRLEAQKRRKRRR
jgi:HTH-type transcriptional regulator, competence development regulator